MLQWQPRGQAGLVCEVTLCKRDPKVGPRARATTLQHARLTRRYGDAHEAASLVRIACVGGADGWRRASVATDPNCQDPQVQLAHLVRLGPGSAASRGRVHHVPGVPGHPSVPHGTAGRTWRPAAGARAAPLTQPSGAGTGSTVPRSYRDSYRRATATTGSHSRPRTSATSPLCHGGQPCRPLDRPTRLPNRPPRYVPHAMRLGREHRKAYAYGNCLLKTCGARVARDVAALRSCPHRSARQPI